MGSKRMSNNQSCRGLILLAACKTLHRCGSVAQAEALACLEGILLEIERVHMPTILESDNADVVASFYNEKLIKIDVGKNNYAVFSSKVFFFKLPTFPSHQNFPTHTNFQLFRYIVLILTKLPIFM